DGKVNALHVVPLSQSVTGVAHGEQCDNLNAVDSATCNKDCSLAFCGDGYTNMMAGEQCDTKGQSSTCNANCTNRACGDGIVNAAAGEQCDVLGGADTNSCNGNTGTPTAAQCHV